MARPSARAVAALGGLLALTGAGPARAGEPAGSPTASEIERNAEITGRVRKIDPATHTLFLRDSMKTFRFSEDTKAMKGGQKFSLLQLNEGEQVRVTFSGTLDNDDVKMTRLEVLP